MANSAIKLAPSILAADFARLGEQVLEAERAGADRIHVDVMDGHFVPNISIGPLVVRSLKKVTRLPLETHLMISEPDRYLDAFAQAGAGVFVAGSAIFGAAQGIAAAMERLRTSGRGRG